MPKTVRFHEIGDASVLRLEEEPLRDPGPGEVRFRAEALGFMFADILFRTGQYPEKAILPGAGVGYEASGVVDAVGPGVSEFREGDRATSFTNFSLQDFSAHRESVVLPARCVTPVPARLGMEEGAGFWNAFLTSYCGIAEAGALTPGQVVLATAATSSIGTAAVQVVKRLGGIFIGTTRSEEKVKLLRDLGADHVVVTSKEDLGERIDEITGGRGVDLVFDAVGGTAFQSYGRMTAPHGRIMSYGALTLEMPVMPMLEVMAKQLKVSAYTLFEHTGNAHFHAVEQPAVVARAKRFILDGLELGALKPVIAKVFQGFDGYVDAVRHFEQGGGGGKVVVRL
jgi:NADPH:quinone reductase-like Zn-dependent oxidoreductase